MAETSITNVHQRPLSTMVVDVREDSEVAEGMIPGAVHIPLGQLEHRLSELDPSTPIVTVCRSGKRSAAAADTLTDAGFTADTMAGGMIAWTEAGLPTE